MRKLLAPFTVAAALALGALPAVALPIAPPPATPVAGIPEPCTATNPWPEDASVTEIRSQLEEHYHVRLAGSYWQSQYRTSIKILWETLDALACTDYFSTLQDKVGGNIGINAASTDSWAWGDWSLTKSGYVTLDFQKFKTAIEDGDEGRLVRLIVHEFAHAWSADRYEDPDYWKEFQQLERSSGAFSDYAGSSVSETFADAVGYYVGRCALNNPYDTGEQDDYYDFVKEHVFDGREFGPAPGEKPDCTEPKETAAEPIPDAQFSASAPISTPWLQALVGE